MDIRKRKWIDVLFTFSSYANGLIENKRFMKECAKEIGWVFVEEKDGHLLESGLRAYSLSMVPDKKCLISPEKLSKIIDKLTGFIAALVVNNNLDHPKFFRETMFVPGDKAEDFLLVDNIDDFLQLRYRLMDRVELEKKHPEMAKMLFRMTLQENFANMDLGTSWVDRLKKGREVVNRRSVAKKQLLDFFGIKV